MLDELPDWGIEGLQARFEIRCRKCGSTDIAMDTISAVAPQSCDDGVQTGGEPGEVSIGCNACKQNDFCIYV